MSIQIRHRTKRHRGHWPLRLVRRFSPPFATACRAVNAINGPFTPAHPPAPTRIAARRSVTHLMLNPSWRKRSTAARTLNL